MKHLVPALLVCLALASFNPAPALAAPAPNAPPGKDAQTHPLVMQQAASEVATAPTGTLQPFRAASRIAPVGGPGGPQREIFGFGLLSSLADPTVGYPSWNFSLLSTVAVFGLHVNDNGNFASDSGSAVWNSSQLTGLVNTAHASGTKVVLTVILQDFSGGTPHMCAGLANRMTTVSQTYTEVVAKGVDGINLDYEGLNTNCPGQPSARAMMTDLVHQMRVRLPGSYISVDTYASSAGDPAGFFDVPGMNPYADSFFVMAYDSDYSNYNQAPLNCPSYCLNPVSPLSGYYYNDTRAAAEYKAAVPAGKVILGLPYYSRGACTGSWAPNSKPETGYSPWALHYRAAVAIQSDPSNSQYGFHRDVNDGVTAWSTWYSSNPPPTCAMEMYWDDVSSLSLKYDLINRDGLRGVGLWNLNLGGGAPELWGALSTYFSCPVTVSVPTAPTSTEFSVGIDAGGCSVAAFDVQQYDSTLNQGWYGLPTAWPHGGSGSTVAEGYPGSTYQFRARAHSAGGVVGAWANATVTVASNATSPHSFKGLYTLDGYGGIHAADSPPLTSSAYWAGWNIARAAKALPASPQSGFVLDGYGGLHPYGAPGLTETSADATHRWNWDIARDFAFLPDGSGGIILDGYGGLHAVLVNGNTRPLQITPSARWGWDIARKLVIFPDMTGGYVLDGWGHLHPFGINGPVPAAAASVVTTAYWPGWDIAHDLVLIPGNGNESGYIMDGYGGLHPFHPQSDGSVLPPSIQTTRWGWDIARTVWLLPGLSGSGYTMDGWGGFHPFGNAAPIVTSAYWPGWDIARIAWGG